MAAERSMQVRLDLLVGDYVKNAERAGKATEGIAASVEKPASALDKIKDAGRDLGKTMVEAAGIGAAAVAAWTASAVSAGVAYNSLQQTAGSALETLMGSAEAASAQMEELVGFARTSPFPRQLWIQAQQTLIGFGVEAERVVPIFEALQDGVVAVGGSAQQIEEVVLILAKMSSVGKVTAEDLNELGVRGIDAATLVGDAWGMTAAQVRDSMSEGAIDATDFMDTLVAQMSDKYGGAAEGLRTTWVGALDRIAGATRDIGSVLAEPFIDPQGGGAAVQWANDIADALRAFEAALRPAVEVLAQRAEPAFRAASEAMQRFSEYLKDLDLVAVLDHLSGAAPILTAFGAAAAAAGSASALSAVGLVGLASAINPVAAGILGLAAASPAFRDVLVSLVQAVAPLIPTLAELALQIGEGLVMAIDTLMPFVEFAISLVGGMVQLFAALPEPIQQAAIAVGAFAFALRRLGPVGAILAGVTYIATAVSSITSSSVEASLSVNDLADDLRDFHQLGQSFRLQDADFTSITGPLAEDMELIQLRAEGIGREYGTMTATGRQWIEVQEGALVLTREYIDAQGELVNVFSAAGTSLGEDFAEQVGVVDQAMAQLVAEGMDAAEVFDLVVDSTGLTREELELIAPLLDEYNVQAERQAEANAQAADEQAAFAAKVGESVAALQELASEMRAQVDPVFAAIRALQSYEDAQDTYNEALAKHGEGSQEVLDAELALVEAYLDAAAAAGLMAEATGGELPVELIAAAEAAGISEEGIRLLEEQFYATQDAGRQFGDDLANVNADISTSTGKMAAQHALELAGMESDYAAFVLNSINSVDSLMDAGWSYADAIAFVAEQSGRSTEEIEAGFKDAREAGREFSDEYPAHVVLHGDEEVIEKVKSVINWMGAIDRTVNIAFRYTSSGNWRDYLPTGGTYVPYSTGGPVGGPMGAGDVVPAMLTPGEHVWTRDEVSAAGGHSAMEALRSAVLSGQTRYTHPGFASVSAASTMPAHFTATAVIDLGEGVQRVMDVQFERHDWELAQRVRQGAGARR